jgi:hypothetical protein
LRISSWKTSQTGGRQAQQAALQQQQQQGLLALALALLLLVVVVRHQVVTRWCSPSKMRATLCWPRL